MGLTCPPPHSGDASRSRFDGEYFVVSGGCWARGCGGRRAGGRRLRGERRLASMLAALPIQGGGRAAALWWVTVACVPPFANSDSIFARFGFNLVGCVQVRRALVEVSSPDPNPFSFSQFSLRFASPCSSRIVKLVFSFLRRLQTGQITTVRPARRDNPILVCFRRKTFRFLFVFYLQIVWANVFLD